MESNRFILGCMSICPETSCQKIESQRVYLSIKTMDLYVMISLHAHTHTQCDR